jgi:hypothetical protein
MNIKAMRLALARLQARTDTVDLDAIAALNEALAEQSASTATSVDVRLAQQEPFPNGVLFAVEEAVRNGDCPWQIEEAFDDYEAERRAAHGIKGST